MKGCIKGKGYITAMLKTTINTYKRKGGKSPYIRDREMNGQFCSEKEAKPVRI
jgi:hypothetical protein